MKGRSNRLIRRGNLPRRLRQRMTDAERLLWRRLRLRQLSGWKFRRQSPYENYILDFVCLEAKLIVEVDGGQHAEHAIDDAARDASLRSVGFRVLRFWNNQVMQETDAVVEVILSELARTPPPSWPSP